VSQEAVGEVTVVYLEERPFFSDEGPFLREERALLDAIAEHVGRIAARISAESGLEEMNRRLRLESQALQESNAALRVLLARIEQERQETRKDIQTNVGRVIIPILQALEVQVSAPQRMYLQMLRKNLDDLTSPFVGRLVGTFPSLTPTEVSVCNMIRNGLRTKEIAETRGVSPATVNRQRERIRDKLGITNKDVNLATFLQSRMPDRQS
jgi:DNA-binding CsgD family transcriptional regulator